MLRFMKTLIGQNYELKVLLYHLFSSNIQNFPPLATNKDNILEHFYGINIEYDELSLFIQIIFEMYPVQPFKKLLLKQIFKMSETNEFKSDHPLANFNFQYLIGIKFICKMIENKELKPMIMNANKKGEDLTLMAQSVHRYYQDLMYLSKMKRSNEYHVYHFAMTNVADMAFYRKFSQIYNENFIYCE